MTKWRFAAGKNMLRLILMLLGLGPIVASSRGDDGDTNHMTSVLSTPLSLADAVNIALQHNGEILKGQHDLEAQYGVVVQTRAIAIPHLQSSGNYQYTTELENQPDSQLLPFTVPGTEPIRQTVGPQISSWSRRSTRVGRCYRRCARQN